MGMVLTDVTISGPQPLLDDLSRRLKTGSLDKDGYPTLVTAGTELQLRRIGRRFDSGGWLLVDDDANTLTLNAAYSEKHAATARKVVKAIPWSSVSLEYPDLTFRVCWDASNSQWLAGCVTYSRGVVVEDIAYYGYFTTCIPGQMPVHHYTLEGVTTDDEATLSAAGLVVDTTEHHGELVVRDPDTCRKLMDDAARSHVRIAAWTLDENTYLSSIDTLADFYQRDEDEVGLTREETDARITDLLEVVRRPVYLTESEIGVLADHCASAPKREYYIEEKRLIFSASKTPHSGFRPTPRMIRHLLPGATETRREQLLAALSTPAWAGVNGQWPIWDHRAEDWRRDFTNPPPRLAADPASIELAMSEFARELQELSNL